MSTHKTQTFREELDERFGGEGLKDEVRQTWQDLATHGASGGFPGLTYYTETGELYDRHEEEIWTALEEDAENMGAENVLAFIATFGGAKDVQDLATFKNLMVWYLAERVANGIADAMEEEA